MIKLLQITILSLWQQFEERVLTRYFSNFLWVLIAFCAVAAIATYRSWILPVRIFQGVEWTGYNNYLIFKNSFFHLIGQIDLYSLYPETHGDLYKYSPAFALFMGLFAWMPDWLGLFFWNLLNALTLIAALRLLPLGNEKKNVYIMWFVLVELLTAAHNDQANGLMAGLIVLSFVLLERKNVFWAAFCIITTAFIKLFGIIAILLIFFYDKKLRFIGACVLWVIIFGLIPLLVIPSEQLMVLYNNWLDLLLNDYSGPKGYSVTGWLTAWFGWDISNEIVLVIGAIALLLPLTQKSKYASYPFRLMLLVSILIWVVIFNHKAEEATFVIALAGVGLWFFHQPPKPASIVLILLAFIFTSFADRKGVFPEFLRLGVFQDYVVKVIPCILIWIKVIWEMMAGSFDEPNETDNILSQNYEHVNLRQQKLTQ